MDPSLLVSPLALDRLEEYSDEFNAALVQSEDFVPWAAQLGYIRSSDALSTTWPLSLDTAGYKEFAGDFKRRTLYGRKISLRTKVWADGVEINEADLRDPGFIGWNDAPANMAIEWRRLPNELAAAMLEDNPLCELYSDPDSGAASTVNLFSASHLYNVLMPALGGFANDIQTTVAKIKSGEFFKEIEFYFDTMKGPNGKSMKLSMTGGNFLCNPFRKTLFKETLESDTLIRAVSNAGVPDATSNVVAAITQNNIYKGTYGYVVGDELTEDDVFYAIAAPKPGNHVWVGQQESTPKEIVRGYDDPLYKDHLKLGVNNFGSANVGPCLPHRIVRVTITG